MNLDYRELEEFRNIYVKKLLWENIVEEHLKPLEVDVIQKQIGTARIEENEDLFRELKALLEILVLHRGSSSKIERKMTLFRHSNSKYNLLQARIQQLASNLHSRTVSELAKSDESNRKILNYTNPKTPRDAPKRLETPRPSTRQSEGSTTSSGSIISDDSSNSSSLDLEKVKNDLNVFNIDKIVEDIRESLDFEKQLLLEDIEYGRNLLDNESKFQNEVRDHRPPTFRELKNFEDKLKECAKEEKREEFKKKLPGLKKIKEKKKLIPSTSAPKNGKSNNKKQQQKQQRKKQRRNLRPLKRKTSENNIHQNSSSSSYDNKENGNSNNRGKHSTSTSTNNVKKKKKRKKLKKLTKKVSSDRLKLNLEPLKRMNRY